MAKPVTLSVICASRPKSPFLKGFIESFLETTQDAAHTELWIMHPFSGGPELSAMLHWAEQGNIHFVEENYGYGRYGHHIYLNELAKKATGDWVLELCEDMLFLTSSWDTWLRAQAEFYGPHQVRMLVPHFKPMEGAMAHLVSRGYLDVAGEFAGCWSVDTWVNMLFEKACLDRAHEAKGVWFYDATHDPEKAAFFAKGPTQPRSGVVMLPGWDAPEVQAAFWAAVARVKDAIARGR